MTVIDHLRRARAYLDDLRVYRRSEEMELTLEPILRDIERVESVIELLSLWASIPTQSGALLDKVGNLPFLNVPRPAGMADEIYRLFIRAAILANNSNATHADVFAVAQILHFRNLGYPVSVTGVKPFTVVAVVPGLLGVEISLARRLLTRAIGVTDRLFLLTPTEGGVWFKYDPNPPPGPYDLSKWIPEA